MVTINLLPWRGYEKKYQIKQLKLQLCLAMFFSIMGIIIIYGMVLGWEYKAGFRVTALTNEFNHYQQYQLWRTKINNSNSIAVTRQPMITQYKTNRLLAALGKKQQEEVCFTEIMRNKNTILFSGKTRSAADLTDYLKHWNAANLFTEIKLEFLEQEKNDLMRFRFLAQENH